MRLAHALIIDTDIELYNRTVSMWAGYGIKSQQVDDIESGLKEISNNKYQLIVIVEHKEMRTEVLNSLKIFRELTSAQLVIASRDTIDADYIISGYDMGADEVWEMPERIEVAIAKGNALIRRYVEWNKRASKNPTLIINQPIVLSTEQRVVLVKGTQVELIKKEFDILRLLMAHPGHVFTYEQIFCDVWGEEYVDNSKNVLWNIIMRLRTKLHVCDGLPDFIKTKHGIGYSFDP